jgi:hypothetical protein
VFDGNVQLLTHTATLLNFGRIDVSGNDGAWFNFNSGISDKGREAVKAMEAGNIVVNLVNPSPKLLGDVLDTTARPFLVTLTGAAPPDPALIKRMNQKNTLLLFECDPADPQGCVGRLLDLKKQFGDSDNLVVSVRSGGNTDAAKRAIYMALVKAGWTMNEIYAVFGAGAGSGGGRGGGGNLSRLVPQPARSGM